MKQEILNQLELKENHEYECKLAANGLPVSMWEHILAGYGRYLWI